MSVFINTRPSERATPLTLALKQENVNVLELPLLQLTAVKLTKQDTQTVVDLLLGKYDVLIVVSPTAAEMGCDYVQSLSDYKLDDISSDKAFQTVQIVAVGQATADALSKFGASAIIPNNTNNEGMLALECISTLDKNSRVLIWRGQGGRKLLIDELSRHGVQVDVLELYIRQLPDSTAEKLNQWLIDDSSSTHGQRQDITVLISSGEAFDHWQQLITTQTTMLLSEFKYLALGKRLSNKLAALNLRHQIIEDLQPSTIISTIH